MPQNNISLAGCIIRDQQGSILLLHRNTPKRQQWEIPGGKIEPGETAKEAAIREVKEELGVEVKLIKSLGSKEFTEDNKVMSYSWFEAEIISGHPKVMETEIFDKLQYFSRDELKTIWEQLSPNTQNFHNMFEDFLLV